VARRIPARRGTGGCRPCPAAHARPASVPHSRASTPSATASPLPLPPSPASATGPAPDASHRQPAATGRRPATTCQRRTTSRKRKNPKLRNKSPSRFKSRDITRRRGTLSSCPVPPGALARPLPRRKIGLAHATGALFDGPESVRAASRRQPRDGPYCALACAASSTSSTR